MLVKRALIGRIGFVLHGERVVRRFLGVSRFVFVGQQVIRSNEHLLRDVGGDLESTRLPGRGSAVVVFLFLEKDFQAMGSIVILDGEGTPGLSCLGSKAKHTQVIEPAHQLVCGMLVGGNPVHQPIACLFTPFQGPGIVAVHPGYFAPGPQQRAVEPLAWVGRRLVVRKNQC